MKTQLQTLILLGILLSITAFSKKEKTEQKYTIIGQVTGFPNGTKFYLTNLSTEEVFDSATVENNSFKFEGHLTDSPEQIWLQTTVNKEFIYTNLLIGNDKITIKGDITDFPWNVTIKGAKTQEDFNYSQSIIKKYNIKRKSLVNDFLKLTPEKQQEIGPTIWAEIGKIDKTTDSLRINYIKSHLDTYTSVIELGFLKNKIPKDTIQKIFDKYTPEIKESKYAQIIKVFLKENISKIGDKYHDFEGLSQNGKKVIFSNIRKKHTLIDFTSAYCGPCIQAANELVEISRNYSDSLTIVSFSGDPKKEDWLKSLKRDNVTWNSLWDGKGRYS
ncbi:MAG TPA: DUF4369 domain-containing protein, partial [Flavobacterium sp.]|nr:DUF4369 domain-containing protein [Flavobacterium sp.]